MTPLAQGVLVVCAVAITIAVVPTLLAVWRAANHADAVLAEIERQVRPLSAEVEALTREARFLSHQAAVELGRVSGVLRGLEDVSLKVGRVAGLVLGLALITNAGRTYTAAADRLAGYQQALEAAGIPYDETLVEFGDFSPHSGVKSMDRLLQLCPRPTAVFAASDTVALGALQAIRVRGLRVPDDVALVGFDDVPLSELVDPPLTTIRLPAYGLGWGAADLLIRAINQEVIRERSVLLESTLIVRQSCGAAPRA